VVWLYCWPVFMCFLTSIIAWCLICKN